MIYSREDAISANRRNGGHFFDPDTMRSFQSRVSENVYPVANGAIIVTSEKDRPWYGSYGYSPGAWEGRRRYTVRKVTDAGEVEEVSEFGEYASASGAHARAAREAKNETQDAAR